jgi:putative oxygen-independent coproporphyrinogen III oxidase
MKLHRVCPRGAYVHIPFCRRRCFYCDFPVSVVGDRKSGENSGTIAEYVEVLIEEIEATPRSPHPLETVFFGGGTPSLLTAAQIDRLLTVLDRQFGIASDAEISAEMDPGTFDRAKLSGYARSGVNRVSLGVQAFEDDLLKLCGRSHDAEDIFTAVENIRHVGIPNFSLDLISGLPHQSLEQWRRALDRAIAISPNHLSCYDLVVEPVTPFGRFYKPGDRPLPDDDLTAQMYRLAAEMLSRAGYEHYEVSNYAKKGFQCRHNRLYWENQPYYGFGMGATSYVGDRRCSRPRTRKEYYEWVARYKASGGAIDEPPTSTEDRLLETLMLGFRLSDGVNLLEIRESFGAEAVVAIVETLQVYDKNNWIEGLDRSGAIGERRSLPARVRLTDPEGFLFSNTILASLFESLTVESR